MTKNIISLNKPKKLIVKGDLIYMRENIKEITIIDELFGNERSAYMYDEKECLLEDTNSEDIKTIKEDIKLLQLAVAELLLSNENDAIALNTIYEGYSAISQMYANMIKNGIYTIDRVPEKWRAEVEAVLAL